mmetsp:Transcript_14600/g.34106  ORF Transcript_14600/g.34106 Transcript_14600/m.34106 type:complete len:212 (+) Transcript_14600:4780-5415(+)
MQQRAAETPDVRLAPHTVRHNYLRGQVHRRALYGGHLAVEGVASSQPPDSPKIGQLHHTILVHQDVRRFNVPVNYSVSVEIDKARDSHLEIMSGERLLDSAKLFKHLQERSAWHILQHNVEQRWFFRVLVQRDVPHNVGVRQPQHDIHFLPNGGTGGGRSVLEFLHGVQLPSRFVESQIHLSEGTTTEKVTLSHFGSLWHCAHRVREHHVR